MSAPGWEAASLPVRLHRVARSHGSLRVLDEVSFEVRPGERFCLIGSNGAGKSTLLSILAGLRRPHAGEAALFGMDPADPRLKARRGIQLERPFFPYYAKVKEVVWLFAGMHPRGGDVRALLERSRLRGDAYVRHLSKGQRQRLALLLATLGDPDLLILDEPTSGLDPETRMVFWRAVAAHLEADARRSLLFTTHDLAEAAEWATRVAILHRGRIAASGTPEELCRRWVGTQMKLQVVARDGDGAGRLAALVPGGLAERVVAAGRDLSVYTDQPKEVLELLPIEETVDVRVRHVSLEDVFLRVTAEGQREAVHEIAAD